MHIKAPRLLVNRHGVYYFRIKADGKEKRISLRTKCSNTANIIALQLNLAVERKRAMTNPKLSDFDFSSIDRYEISLPNGMKIKTDGTQADHDRAMEALEKIGPIPLSVQLRRAAEEEIQKSESLVSVVDKWLANCAGKNADRTITAKGYHIKNFFKTMFPKVASVDLWLAEHESKDFYKKRGLRLYKERQDNKAHEFADIEVNAVTKKLLTEYKSRLGSGVNAQAAKTIDNKLDSLDDLMTYAIGHGLYTASKDNPVDGLRIQTKKARIAKRIFPNCRYINFSYYKKLSAAMLEHQRELNIKFEQTSFHSFRVNVITELHNKDANAAKIIKIVGHEDGSGIKAQAVHLGYVRDLPDCKKIVDLLEWPIDLSALKYDGRFKSFVTDQKNWAPDIEEELERKKAEDKAAKKAEAKAKKRKEKLEE